MILNIIIITIIIRNTIFSLLLILFLLFKIKCFNYWKYNLLIIFIIIIIIGNIIFNLLILLLEIKYFNDIYYNWKYNILIIINIIILLFEIRKKK